ncbi:hypothetical protein [Pseudonocardia sp. MH-G8]|uniref:hypothetical protein n=1 Tax=Pseudonocardia sp. MH-G8 TaxID=1854588 RepID=UPI001304255F|nr:hypothetical protein [Pseudonocardia sp. MH-G8]
MLDALDPSVPEAPRGYDSPTPSDAIETFDVRPPDEGYPGADVGRIRSPGSDLDRTGERLAALGKALAG